MHKLETLYLLGGQKSIWGHLGSKGSNLIFTKMHYLFYVTKYIHVIHTLASHLWDQQGIRIRRLWRQHMSSIYLCLTINLGFGLPPEIGKHWYTINDFEKKNLTLPIFFHGRAKQQYFFGLMLVNIIEYWIRVTFCHQYKCFSNRVENITIKYYNCYIYVKSNYELQFYKKIIEISLESVPLPLLLPAPFPFWAASFLAWFSTFLQTLIKQQVLPANMVKAWRKIW